MDRAVRDTRFYYWLGFHNETEANMATEAALLLGKSTGGGVKGTPGSPRKLPQKQMEVPLRLSIPVDQIVILPVEEGWAARLEISVQVMDKNRIASDVQVFQASLLSVSPPLSGANTYYDFTVTLRAQPHDLAVTLRDMVTGELLTASTEVRP